MKYIPFSVAKIDIDGGLDLYIPVSTEKVYNGKVGGIASMVKSNKTVARKFWFKLSHKCLVKKLDNSNKVNFNVENGGLERYVTEFSIIVDDPNENASEDKAIRIAGSICNFISIIRGKFVRPYLYGRAAVLQDGKVIPTSSDLWIDFPHEIPLHFDVKTKMQMIIENAETFQFVSNGIRAYEYGDLTSALKNLYLATEAKGSLSSLRKKFEPLRDAVSHYGELFHDTKVRLESNFGPGYFELSQKGTFDYALNQKHLDEQIRILLTGIMRNLRKEIQS